MEARGGVLIMVKANLNPTPYEEGNVDADILWIMISLQPNVTWLIGGCHHTEEDKAQILEKINTLIAVLDIPTCPLARGW